MADDLEIPAEAKAWIEVEARAFFDSGGVEYPRPQGLEAAEIHAFYDLAREDARSSSSVMLAALTKTLGSCVPPASSAAGSAGAPPQVTSPAAPPPAAVASDEGGQALLLNCTGGSIACWPQLALGLEARGSPPTGTGLRAWHRDDAPGLQGELTRLGLKLGHRQRLVTALEGQH